MSCALKVARSFGAGGKKEHIFVQFSLLQCMGARELKYSHPGNFNSAFPAFKNLILRHYYFFFLSHFDYRNLEFF